MSHLGGIWVIKLGIGPGRRDFIVQAMIWPKGWDLSLMAETRTLSPGFGSQGWDLDYQAEIWAIKLGYGQSSWDMGQMVGIWANRLKFGP